jgi:parallel beta-helix repeat protein
MGHASPYTNIDAATAYTMITSGSYPSLVVLDVRTKSEYDGGHIYGAVWIPVTELEARIGELAGHENHEIIVYCGVGGRSATASGILDAHGFTKVYNMMGGISAWQSAGYPVWIATVHNVNTTFNYDTIRAAINASQTLDGHTIHVDAGTYSEYVAVNKSLTLVGENRETTIIDGGYAQDVVFVTANNTSIKSFTIRHSGCGCAGYSGITIQDSYNGSIIGNTMRDNGHGIHLLDSGGYTISCNTFTNNTWGGIELESSQGNNVTGNDIRKNEWGIRVVTSQDNMFYHNNIVNNTYQTYLYESPSNAWDDGYPSGGNYWSNYTGEDLYSGPSQNITGSDGIIDKPYDVGSYSQDRYPLMKPYVLGDLDRDGDVDEDDLWHFCGAFIDYYKIHVKDPLCDFDNNSKIDEDDLWTMCAGFIDYWKAH